MKNSLASILFFFFCFVMVFSSCNSDLDSGSDLDLGEPPEGVIISPAEMRPGNTYEFEVEATDPDGDSLTYAWSLEMSRYFIKDVLSIGFEPVYDLDTGRLHSSTGPVVSYTPPEKPLEEPPGTQFLLMTVKCTVSDGTSEAVFTAEYLYITWTDIDTEFNITEFNYWSHRESE